MEQQTEVSIKTLLEAGAHFGHQKSRWNPKMKRFIFEERDGLYIIDLAKTLQQIKEAVLAIKDMVTNFKSILFVGTKKAAKDSIREVAELAGEFYVSERWLGGTLTNLSTIRKSVKKLDEIEKRIASGREGLKKKELALLTKEQLKLERNLSGIRGMRKLPGLVVVVDSVHEHLAVAEANKLKIPVMGLIDTNANPDRIQHIIPCNDDALKSIKLVLYALGDAIKEAKEMMEEHLKVEEEKKEKEEEEEEK